MRDALPRDWTIGLKLWIERRGRAVLGEGRAALLRGIEAQGSISGAARSLGMSYRRAWLLVQDMNQAAGEPLTEAAIGGRSGGGAGLTPFGRAALAAFDEVSADLRKAAHSAARLAGSAESDERPTIHIAAAISLERVVGRLLADWARRPRAARVRAMFGASNELAEQLLRGAKADLFLSADAAQVERLEKAGMVTSGGSRALARNGLAGIAAAKSRSAARSAEQLLASDIGPIAVAEPACPLGRYTRDYLNRRGLYDRLRDRSIEVDNSRGVVSAVESRRAMAGIVFSSDAAQTTGCRTLFRANTGAAAVEYRAALLRQADGERADELYDFVTSPLADDAFQECGFLRVARSA